MCPPLTQMCSWDPLTIRVKECLFSFIALSTSKTYNIYRHAYGPLNPGLISCVLVSDCDALILRSVIIC